PLPKDNGPLNTLEESFAMFCRGLSMYSPFLDHVLSYWKAYQENPDQTMFLKYEKMRADPLPYVKRLAEFMGCGFTAEEEKEEAVEKVAFPSSFYPKSAYFRKGKVRDWSNYLTPEMAAGIDGLMEERFKGTETL
ncbi:hypothetical protein EUTSA_v10001141mg, partial [Eutrema salsugineum]